MGRHVDADATEAITRLEGEGHMATRIATRAKSRGSVQLAPPRHAVVARLTGDTAALLEVAERLERLAADLHKSCRARDAEALADSLDEGLARHLEDEAALLQSVTADGDERLEDAADRTRDEHLALRELVEPVVRDLRDIACSGLPGQPTRFEIEATVLCEFIRLHVKYKRQTLYPLLDALRGRGSRAGWHAEVELATR